MAGIIQKTWRGYLSRKNNVFIQFKKLDHIFKKEITGYHLINDEALKENTWEEINMNVIGVNHKIIKKASGSHQSGVDNEIDICSLSNKTTKLVGDMVKISSYRLTNVCNQKDIGNKDTIIEEIEKRDKSFDYYSILLRKEQSQDIIEYEWFVIPKELYIFDIKKHGLEPKIGKIGKNKNKQTGWENKYCEIIFSMSSQLWMKFNYSDIKKYKISNAIVDKTKLPKINYSELCKLLNVLNI